MATFNWSPGIGDPTLIGGLTVVLYFLAALGCWITARALEGFAAGGRKEVRAWRWIAIAFVALGTNKQLDLQTAFTEAGRVLANFQGWYDQRQPVQLSFIVLITIACLTAAVVLVRWARQAPYPTWLALIGSISVICYVLIRAASFHHIDRFVGTEVLGVRWNWILEIGGISVVLAASCWRWRQASVQSTFHSPRAAHSRRSTVQTTAAQLHVKPQFLDELALRKKRPTTQIWLTYSELSELLKCELSDVRRAVTENEWSERRSSDGRLRVKLSPALAHQFMMNYVAGLGHEIMNVRVDVFTNSKPAVPGGNCQFVVASQQSPSTYPRAERRTKPRQQIARKAVIRLNRYSVVCTVRDFSPAGVGLTLSDTITLPAEFDLTLDRATRHCLTVWRQLDRVGVKWTP
jgi:hypothetical protein